MTPCSGQLFKRTFLGFRTSKEKGKFINRFAPAPLRRGDCRIIIEMWYFS
jgi:hypothetical protein